MPQSHSVILDVSKCVGCTTCIHNCPTEAIRVRDGHAVILEDKCIDCGECIRVCPHNAKSALTDPASIISDYDYACAIIPPTLIGQYKDEYNEEDIIRALLKIGFDDVFEVAMAAEILGKALSFEVLSDTSKLRISSACPVVSRLIRERYPSLVPNIQTLVSPLELTAKMAREKLLQEPALRNKKIGVFFITPCAAKVSDIEQINRQNGATLINGAISIKDIFGFVERNLKNTGDELPMRHSSSGLGWAVSGGEANFLARNITLNVDGIRNVMNVLDELERGKLPGVVFLEALACTGGCVGGCLCVENAFVAKRRIQYLIENRRYMNGRTHVDTIDMEKVREMYNDGKLTRKEPFLPKKHKPLDEDVGRAIEKMQRIDEIEHKLPGYYCGSCGAPNCRALAQDIVAGQASEMDCIFMLKDAITKLSQDVFEISRKVVPVMAQEQKEDKGDNR